MFYKEVKKATELKNGRYKQITVLDKNLKVIALYENILVDNITVIKNGYISKVYGYDY